MKSLSLKTLVLTFVLMGVANLALARTYNGNYTITDINSYNYLQNFSEINGSLIVDQNAPFTSIYLSNLTRVNGYLKIENVNQLRTFVAPSLAVVESRLHVYGNPNLLNLDLRSATYLGSLTIRNNPSLTTITFDQMVSMGPEPNSSYTGDFFIGDNTNLGSIEFPNLVSVFLDITFYNNSNVERIDVSDLSYVNGDFHISNNDALSNLLIPANVVTGRCTAYYNDSLTHLEMNMARCGSVEIYANRGLVEFKMSRLTNVQDAFTVRGHPLLEEIKASSLSSANILEIQNNTYLKDIYLPALNGSLDTLTISGNNILVGVYLPLLTEIYNAGEIANNAVSRNGLNLYRLTNINTLTIDEPTWSGGCSYFSSATFNNLTVNGTSC